MKSAREEISRAGRLDHSLPNLKGGRRLSCYLELHGSACLLSNDCRSIQDSRARAYFVEAKFDQIASAKFAIDRQIKECKVAPHEFQNRVAPALRLNVRAVLADPTASTKYLGHSSPSGAILPDEEYI